MLKAIFFDLDGTLLPMDENEFTKGYFKLLLEKMGPHGYTDPKKFIDAMWKGVGAMYQNNGKQLNSVVFWEAFASVFGPESKKDEPIFDEFYHQEFQKTRAFVKPNPLAREIVDFCHKNFEFTVLSTNPIFPAIAQATRLSYVGLSPKDFNFVSDYENSCFCKPNPLYFKALLEKFHLHPEEVIVFGNNTFEDGDCGAAIGLRVFLIKDFIIHSEKAKGKYPEIHMGDIIPILEQEKKRRQ